MTARPWIPEIGSRYVLVDDDYFIDVSSSRTCCVIDANGHLDRIPIPPGKRADEMLRPGQRFPSSAEMRFEETLRDRRRAHGAEADGTPQPVPVYALAAELAAREGFAPRVADMDALNVAVVGRRKPQAPWRKKNPVTAPAIACENGTPIDVDAELAELAEHVAATLASGRVVEAAAYVAWRLTWIHPYCDGNGRTSRAAAYAVLCAGDARLLSAHAKRSGAIGTQHLTLPERVERSRLEYIEALNLAHVEADLGPAGYRRFVDLSRLESYLARLVEDQIKGRSSPEDRVCGCRPCGCRP